MSFPVSEPSKKALIELLSLLNNTHKTLPRLAAKTIQLAMLKQYIHALIKPYKILFFYPDTVFGRVHGATILINHSTYKHCFIS